MAHKVVILNAAKMNYDGCLDFSVPGCDVTVYDASAADEILPRCADAEAVVTKELVLTPEQVAALPASVKLIVEAGTGYNNIPLDAVRSRGITLCNVPAYSSQRVAHTAIMLMLNLSSTMQTQIKMLARGDRRNFTDFLMVPHVELNGKTLGVVGQDNIGKNVIKIALAMEMNVLVYTRTPKPDEPGVKHVDLDTLLTQSDYVSLHCPLSPATKHMIGAEQLAKMKKSAFLINTSRGALIDEAALIEALKNGEIAGAGLDVQEVEPPSADTPLYSLENVILTPHMGWKGLETRRRLAKIVVDDIANFFDGTPINVIA